MDQDLRDLMAEINQVSDEKLTAYHKRFDDEIQRLSERIDKLLHFRRVVFDMQDLKRSINNTEDNE